jgi:hypothetical protein
VPRDVVPLTRPVSTRLLLAERTVRAERTHPRVSRPALPARRRARRAPPVRPKARARQRRLAGARGLLRDAGWKTVAEPPEGCLTGLSAVDSARIAHRRGPKTPAATHPARFVPRRLADPKRLARCRVVAVESPESPAPTEVVRHRSGAGPVSPRDCHRSDGQRRDPCAPPRWRADTRPLPAPRGSLWAPRGSRDGTRRGRLLLWGSCLLDVGSASPLAPKSALAPRSERPQPAGQ